MMKSRVNDSLMQEKAAIMVEASKALNSLPLFTEQ
jgi:hypothetical protein